MANQNMNEKAKKFQAYLDDNQLAYFHCQVIEDESGTAIFQSQIPVGDIRLPVGIITDNTIYTIIRVQIGEKMVSSANLHDMEDYVNELNRKFKVFKYMITENGSLFIDACLPSSSDHFDAEVVRAVLDVMIDHLQKEYPTLLEKTK